MGFSRQLWKDRDRHRFFILFFYCLNTNINVGTKIVARSLTSEQKSYFSDQSVSRDDLHSEEEQLWEGPGRGQAGQGHAGGQRRRRRVSRHPTPPQPGVRQHVRR